MEFGFAWHEFVDFASHGSFAADLEQMFCRRVHTFYPQVLIDDQYGRMKIIEYRL
jgi:hypothetical protein